MLDCQLAHARRVLFIGAHGDDIEIGCGGTILKLCREQTDMNFVWYVFSASERRRKEVRLSASGFLQKAQSKKICMGHYRESYFPAQWASIKNALEKLRKTHDPDLIFTHHVMDKHQDHRVLSELTWNTFRDHWIMEYEIPKYDGDMGQPNVYIPLDPAICSLKVKTILQVFKSQTNKHWFSEDAFLGLLRVRGIECAAKYAEAFYCRKMIIA